MPLEFLCARVRPDDIDLLWKYVAPDDWKTAVLDQCDSLTRRQGTKCPCGVNLSGPVYQTSRDKKKKKPKLESKS